MQMFLLDDEISDLRPEIKIKNSYRVIQTTKVPRLESQYSYAKISKLYKQQ
jgi:hypothetical protein